MADFGTLLDFDDTSTTASVSGNVGLENSHPVDPFGTTDLMNDFSYGSSSQFVKVDGFGSDFDPFSMSSEPSSGSVYPVDSTKTGVESKDQYGDLLGDFGSDRSEQKTNGTDSCNDSNQFVATDRLIGIEDEAENHYDAEDEPQNEFTVDHHLANEDGDQYRGLADDEDDHQHHNLADEHCHYQHQIEEEDQHRQITYEDDQTNRNAGVQFESYESPVAKDVSAGSLSAGAIKRHQTREKRQQEFGSRFTNDENACRQCGKRVYPMEMLTADEVVYHKTCFRCEHCNRVLSLLNYSAIDGMMYCKPHFIEMFKLRGNYADGFKTGSRPLEHSNTNDYNEDQSRTTAHSSSPWNDVSDDADNEVVYQPQDAQEEIPVVPLKQVRNIFENLALNSSYESSPVQPSKVTRERSVEKTNIKRGDRLSRERSNDETTELDVVQCSSTVFVIEDELPPAAITRSILAKFRQLESGNDVPMPTKSSLSRNSSISKRAETDTNHSRSTVDAISHVKQSSVERDASRSEASPPKDELDYCNGGDSPADDLPLQGCAKNLLARWRDIEREATARGSEETMAKKRPSSSRRSQSMSRVEVRQRKARPSSDEDEDDGIRVADYLNVHSNTDHDDVIENGLVPSLMTKQVLAKFRSMEDEHKSMEHAQPPLQRQRDDVSIEKSFRWEVKEAKPLSRGNLVVHGDAPRRSISSADCVNNAEDQDETAERPVVLEEELPAPATTRNLLSMFKAMEDPSAAPPTPDTVEKNKSLVRSDSRARSQRSQSALTGSPSRRALENDAVVISNGLDFDVSAEAGEFENEPVFDPSLIRESDEMDGAELPERGTTRGLLAKFQQLQQSN